MNPTLRRFLLYGLPSVIIGVILGREVLHPDGRFVFGHVDASIVWIIFEGSVLAAYLLDRKHGPNNHVLASALGWMLAYVFIYSIEFAWRTWHDGQPFDWIWAGTKVVFVAALPSFCSVGYKVLRLDKRKPTSEPTP
ncbi:MAG: hypothetical protein JST12_16815 [Armatimonadetes bacterium]|nr:hypothetical protein [Armatimonadota bacterium]